MRPKKLYQSKAWKLLRQLVFNKYAKDGIVKCCTCGKHLQIGTKDCQVGHFIKVTDSYALAMEFKNVGPQCSQCNRHHGGRQDVMREWIERTHGPGTVDWLLTKKHNVCKLDKYTLDIYAKEFEKQLAIIK